ncbi:MAG: hypothetical protein EA379_00150 [Phycisphaerales bacterium]|nr:MAG: hypothetical protein EA379_00150 [Phycisphaerales bacterium]
MRNLRKRPTTRSVRNTHSLRIALLGAAPLVLAQSAHAAGACAPSWVQTFSAPSSVVSSSVNAMTVFNDGGGCPALYVAGSFVAAGGATVNRIARWDGTSWTALGDGIGNGTVRALAVFDDGSGDGPALYAGGNFTTAGGAAANSIARWDGQSWSPLGAGVSGDVSALAVYNDGNGEALYVGGFFSSAGGAPNTNNIARWNGAAWSSVGGGANSEVSALAVYNDGSGAALYAGGFFSNVGSSPALPVSRIARWDGASWAALGSGVSGGGPDVYAMVVHDDGSGGGDALYVGGEFTNAGGFAASNVARWDGAAWSTLGSGVGGVLVDALAVYDDGSGAGPALYAGGFFTTAGGASAMSIARWSGGSWSSLQSGMTGFVHALCAFDDRSGAGPALYVGGDFATSAAGDARLAKWQGCAPGVDCPADITNDCRVDFDDLAIVLSNFGQTGPDIPGDVNNDDAVDFEDLSIVLGAFGSDCPL